MKKLDALLSFTRKEKNAILVFITLMLMIWMLPKWFTAQAPPLKISVKELASIEDSLRIQSGIKNGHRSYFPKEEKGSNSNEFIPTIILHDFDPNQINIKEWQAMGVSEKTASTIQRYLSKGGRFNKPEDLHKIWGLPSSLANKLMPYVKIQQSVKKITETAPPDDRFFQSIRVQQSVPINTADSAAWEALPGIGPVLASRIVAYRNRLGGFYSVEQIKEVYGLKDSLFQQLKHRLTHDGSIAKIDLNKATEQELIQHPYIGKKLSGMIKNYRNQHGNFKRLEEIQNIIMLDEISYNKISHYLKVNIE